MNSSPNITFIICTYNRADYLEDTLQSLLQTELAHYNAELLIIDNNSSDQTPQIVDNYGKDDNPIRYIKETNQGLSFARNRGIEEAQGACVVFLDDDIRATNQLIPAWSTFFNEHPKAMAAGGKIHIQFDDPRPHWMSRFLLPLLGHHDLGDSHKTYPQNKYPFGGNMGFRKQIFDRFGSFNTKLGRKGKQLKASEEKEFFNRLKEESIEVHYLPEAKLFHRVNKQRLTEEYIKRQAIGLGQSIALQVNQHPVKKVTQLGLEFAKWLITIGLIVPYTLSLQPAKAGMLVKFRKWIAEGYFFSDIS